MKNIFLILIIFLGCKTNQRNDTREAKKNVTIVNDKPSKKLDLVSKIDSVITKISLTCNTKELPTSCFSPNIDIKFLFNNDPNRIKINNNSYEFETFFEGINYTPYLFNGSKKYFLVLEYIYEYNSKFYVFDVGKDKILLLDTFTQEDLIDKNGDYIDSSISLIQHENRLKVRIGNDKIFKEHYLNIPKSNKEN